MTFRDRYGLLDRVFHRLAFRLDTAQEALSDVEEILFRDRLRTVDPSDPVFVTALPRAGTSILLRILHGTDRFASHLYRDVPCVLCPLLWNRFAGAFRNTGAEEPVERAHGDGLEVTRDTPEAFEEMIWKRFWPEHYPEDRILPWEPDDRNPRFERFFESHVRKVILVRREDPSDRRRYLSKNNVNLFRLEARPGLLEAGTFVVPFREPLQHAASLLRQHRRFLRIHREDSFVRTYMSAVGHHDFGADLRPADVGGWLAGAPEPDGLEFWLRYWVAAHDFVLRHADDAVILIPYGRLVGRPAETLARLGERLGLDRGTLDGADERLRPPRRHQVDAEDVPEALLERARELHGRLLERAGA